MYWQSFGLLLPASAIDSTSSNKRRGGRYRAMLEHPCLYYIELHMSSKAYSDLLYLQSNDLATRNQVVRLLTRS